MPSEKKVFESITESIQDTNLDFEKEYKEYTKYNEKSFDLEYFNYKFKIVLYMSIFISSLFFTMVGAFLWLIGTIKDDLILLTIIFLFGYISIICLFLMKRKRTQFRHILEMWYDHKFI